MKMPGSGFHRNDEMEVNARSSTPSPSDSSPRTTVKTVRRIRLTIEYDGTGYAGWQRQANAVSIQGTIERFISLVADAPVTLHGSGRTDAGVHALGQVAHFDCPSGRPPDLYLRALNKLLPNDIVVLDAADAEPDFHARYSARSKEYRYVILNRLLRSALQRNRAAFVPRPLDLDSMARCLAMLEGTHDFGAFRATGGAPGSPVRTLFEQRMEKNDGYVAVTLRADGFLRHMVRNVMGTLLEVGTGKRSVADFRAVLEGGDRNAAGPTAPPQGLYLVEVRY